MTGTQPDGGTDDFDFGTDDIDHDLAAARLEAAIRDRRRERWAAERLGELRSLADSLARSVGGTVTLQTASGAELRGELLSAGHDAVELRVGNDIYIVAFDAIEAAALPPSNLTSATRANWSLDEALVDLIGSRRRIRIATRGGHVIDGELVAVSAGIAVVMIKTETAIRLERVESVRQI